MKRLLLALIAVSLFGCGGGGGGGAPTPTGKFVDAPVGGMKYVSGGQSGFTGPNGEFTYEVGKPVTFSVGGVIIGQAPGASTITPIDLVNAATSGTTATATTPAVVQIAQFLLSASSVTTTGISIDAAVTTAAASQSINLSTAPNATVVAMINQVAAAAGGTRHITTASEAQSHITASLAGLATGTVVLPPVSIAGGGGSASYKLALQGTFAVGTVDGVSFDLQLPAGVTIKTDAATTAPLASSFFASGTSSGGIMSASFSSGVLKVAAITTSGFSAGEFATVVCDVQAGMTAPLPSAFTIKNLSVIDSTGRTITGTTVTVN